MRPPKWPLLIPFCLYASHCKRNMATPSFPALHSPCPFPTQQASPLQEAALYQVHADTVLVLEHRPSPASLSRESGRAGFGPGQVMLGAGALGGPVGDGLIQVLQGSLLQGVRPEGACATGPQEVLCVLQEAAQASEAGHIHVFPHQPHLGPPEGHSRRWVPERAVKSGAPAHGELSLRRKYKSRSLQLLTSLPPQPLH